MCTMLKLYCKGIESTCGRFINTAIIPQVTESEHKVESRLESASKMIYESLRTPQE